jgi:hypothetical protein
VLVEYRKVWKGGMLNTEEEDWRLSLLNTGEGDAMG